MGSSFSALGNMFSGWSAPAGMITSRIRNLKRNEWLMNKFHPLVYILRASHCKVPLPQLPPNCATMHTFLCKSKRTSFDIKSLRTAIRRRTKKSKAGVLDL